MKNILLIDDDAHLGGPLATYLSRFDLVLKQALMPSKGLTLLREHSFDLLVLDVMLPEMDGFAVCREVRKFSDVPIIMLTARGEVTDRIVGLEMGADDYLPKPFEPRELVARMQAILRRPRGEEGESDEALNFEGLSVHPSERSAAVFGRALNLTSAEFDILRLLASRPGKVFSRDEVLNALRGHDSDVYTRSVDIAISRLRKKILPLDVIKTVRNAGYVLSAQAL